MYIKNELFYFILFAWIMLIQCRPQGETTVKTSEKFEPVSSHFYIILLFNI